MLIFFSFQRAGVGRVFSLAVCILCLSRAKSKAQHCQWTAQILRHFLSALWEIGSLLFVVVFLPLVGLVLFVCVCVFGWLVLRQRLYSRLAQNSLQLRLPWKSKQSSCPKCGIRREPPCLAALWFSHENRVPSRGEQARSPSLFLSCGVVDFLVVARLPVLSWFPLKQFYLQEK